MLFFPVKMATNMERFLFDKLLEAIMIHLIETDENAELPS
jgi:hypothetical protein